MSKSKKYTVPKPTSIRLKDDISQQLEKLAQAVKRPKTWIIEEAISNYIQEQSWQITAIQQELDDHNAGKGLDELVTYEVVMKQLEARIRSKLS